MHCLGSMQYPSAARPSAQRGMVGAAAYTSIDSNVSLGARPSGLLSSSDVMRFLIQDISVFSLFPIPAHVILPMFNNVRAAAASGYA
jgi:hypothetical protein